MLAAVFGPRRREGPSLRIEIELSPCHPGDFIAPLASKNEELDELGIWLSELLGSTKPPLVPRTGRSLYAQRLAEAIGEVEYFRNKMRRILTVHASMREAGLAGNILPLSWLLQISSSSDAKKLAHSPVI
jgi:hypothetical protein